MTRFLSESLQAPEPYFGLHLRRLEQSHGNPGTDIKLTNNVMLASNEKLRQIGLDASDTTAQELYLALNARVRADDTRLTKTLRTIAGTHVSAEAEVVAGMAHELRRLSTAKTCFAIKPTVFKTLLKAQPPKKVMKSLGYRSLESMLKQEPLAAIMAAAAMTESPTWRRTLKGRYKKLTASDFETRPLAIVHPNSNRWRSLTQGSVAAQKHNLLAFSELGAIVLLPLPTTAPAGAVTVSLALALQASNQVQSSSTFLKLCRVRPDFGSVVKAVASGEPKLQTSLLDRQIPWQLIQRYYARARHFFHDELFEPHIRREDLTWHSVEHAFSSIEPSFAFWHGSNHLGIVHGQKLVSLNLIDAALNVCNGLTFEQRMNGHSRESLWQELQLGYLQPKTVEQTLLAEIQPKLAYAPAIA